MLTNVSHILVKSEDNKESLRPLLDKKVLSKSRDVNLDDEIKTKKIISTKRRPGLEKLIEKAKNLRLDAADLSPQSFFTRRTRPHRTRRPTHAHLARLGYP